MNVVDYARKAFPKVVADRLERLKKDDKTATYEQALKAVAKEDPDFYDLYSRGIGSEPI